MIARTLILARLITNAAACALVVPFLLLCLILILNPEVAPGAAGLIAGWLTLVAAYGTPILLGLPIAFTVVRFFAARPLRIGWFHLKAVVWFLAAGIGGALAVDAWSFLACGDLLGSRGRLRLGVALAATSACWAAGVVATAAAQMRRAVPSSRARWTALALLAGAAPASLLAWSVGGPRGAESRPAPTEAGGRGATVALIGIEGAAFSEILPLVSEGRLPNLARLLKEGAYGPLRTIRPCRSLPAWASLSTGKNPSKHGVKDPRVYSLAGVPAELRTVPAGIFFRRWLPPALLESRPASGRDLRAKPLWAILDEMRLEAAFLHWPLTDAPIPHGLAGEAADRAARAVDRLDRLRPRGAGRVSSGHDAAILESVADDLEVTDAMMRLLSTSRPRFLAAHLPGLGPIAARFVKYAHPEVFGGADQEEVEVYGHVLARYYEMLDQIVGDVRTALPPDGYLVVVSAFGTEPLGPLDRLSRRLAGLPRPPAGHDSAPAGVLALAGPGVAPGRRVDDLKITDVVPMTLYFLGFPVGRDMDGRLPNRLFERPFLEAHSITFVPTYG